MKKFLVYFGVLVLFGGLCAVFVYNEKTKTGEGRVILSNYKVSKNQGKDAAKPSKYDCRLLVSRPFDTDAGGAQVLNSEYDLRNCK